MDADRSWKLIARRPLGALAAVAAAPSWLRRWRAPSWVGRAADPLGAAVAAGIAAGRGSRRGGTKISRAARRIRARVRQGGDHEAAIAELLILVGAHPRMEEIQRMVATLFDEMGDASRAAAAWRGIVERFPESKSAFQGLLAHTLRQSGPGPSRELVRAQYAATRAQLDELLSLADAWELIGDAVEAEGVLRRATELFPDREEAWLAASSWFEKHGRYWCAADFLRRAGGAAGSSPAIVRKLKEIESLLKGLEAVAPGAPQRSRIASVSILDALFEQAIAEREARRAVHRSSLDSVMMVVGSLGSGGAERQFVNTAIELHRLAVTQGRINGYAIRGPVRVVVQSLVSRSDGKFFLPHLRDAGVPVTAYEMLPDFGGSWRSSASGLVLNALKFLPPAIARGVIKLTDAFRTAAPDVVQIWQDGIIYAVGLAAVLSGVPRIVLNARTLPPKDRWVRYPVEYDIIYKSLLRCQGVTLTVNSRHLVGRYAAWLGVDRECIEVIPNGVKTLSSAPDRSAEALFRAFHARTGTSALTLGAVMRFDDNKRPLLWIDAAAAIHQALGSARFIIVGDGLLRRYAMARARAHGIADRCLFVGRSSRVGYWLSKMDLLMLLSKREGLPNALIEAQLARVPVITTPAGGAVETVIPEVTGIVTNPAPSPEEIAAIVRSLVQIPGRLHAMGLAAENWAERTFSVSGMLAKTVEVFMNHDRSPPAERVVDEAGAGGRRGIAV